MDLVFLLNQAVLIWTRKLGFHEKYNLHFKSQPISVVVDFVTEAGLPNLVSQILAEDDTIEEKLFTLKKKKL